MSLLVFSVCSMRKISEQIDDEEAETNTEKSSITEFNTGNTNTEAVTDGGTDVVREYNEVRTSNDAVRNYSADGRLYAYREGDEHIVVSHGREPQDRWTKCVPAERDAVLTGEHLWTIPENWRHRLIINGAGHSRYAVYSIPETNVDVLVSVPNKTRLVDAWYGIKRVGTFNVTFDDAILWDELEATIETVRDTGEVSDEAVGALETLYSHHRRFERKYVEKVNTYAEDAVMLGRGTPTVQQWTSTPWVEVFDVDRLVQRILDVDKETCDTVIDVLFEDDILPRYPTVRVDVEEDESTPDGYELRALCEAGASPAASVDYLITEYYDLMSQDAWAEIRGAEEEKINEKVGNAAKKLSE